MSGTILLSWRKIWCISALLMFIRIIPFNHIRMYIEYFEMRAKQTNMLHNLHYEVKKIREMPKQAAVIAEYIEYMSAYVVEVNIPNEQLEKLEMMLEKLKEEELPVTRTEFESRAILYHILTELGIFGSKEKVCRGDDGFSVERILEKGEGRVVDIYQ